MSPIRFTNINKRVSGNGSVIGPTCNPSCVQNDSICCSIVSTLCGSTGYYHALGSRYGCNCCPVCDCCCCCTCSVCTRNNIGLWKMSEVYTYKLVDKWGPSTCSNTAPVGFCNNSRVLYGNSIDCCAYFIACSGSIKCFIAPSNTQVSAFWGSRGGSPDTTSCNCAINLYGNPSPTWFTPGTDDFSSYYQPCRGYWDSYSSQYWTGSQERGYFAYAWDMSNNNAISQYKTNNNNSRVGRYTNT